MLYLFFMAMAVVAAVYIYKLYLEDKAGIHEKIKSIDIDGNGKTFVDESTGVKARPDALTETTVVEFKSRMAGKKPLLGHELQTMASMVASGRPKGLLMYMNRKFEYTNSEGAWNRIAREQRIMKAHLIKREPPKGSPTRKKCLNCDFGDECSDSLKKSA